MDSLPVRLSPSNLRPIAYRILSKKHGLNIKTDALAKLTEAVSLKFGAEWKGRNTQDFLEEVARIWKLEDRGLFLDEDGITQVLKSMEVAQKTPSVAEETPSQVIPNWKEYFRVINPPDQPTYEFDKARKQFFIANNTDHAKASIDMFANRFNVLSYRLSRNTHFQKNSFSSIASFREDTAVQHEITQVKNMLGRDGEMFMLFGLLSKNANDDWILEDASDYVELRLDQAYKNEATFYGAGMFVLVEGIYNASGGNMNNRPGYMGGCFYVSNIGHPSAETRDKAIDTFGYLDFMGINQEDPDQPVTRLPKELKKKLAKVEKSLPGHKFVFLGAECHLDNPKVMAGLRKFFGQMEASLVHSEEMGELEDGSAEGAAPLAIVMTGSFVSEPLVATATAYGATSASERYKQCFDELAQILDPLPRVKQCKFVLVPGKNDPWQSTYSQGSAAVSSIPQKPLPNRLVSRLARCLRQNLVLAWNPVRINYLTQEILVVKDDYMTKFKRNDIIFANDVEQMNAAAAEEDAMPHDQDERLKAAIRLKGERLPNTTIQARRLVKTLLDQGTMQPFLPSKRLVDAAYNHVLRLEPMPSVMILQDPTCAAFEVSYFKCKVINMGPLLAGSRKLQYGVYQPATQSFAFKEQYF
ncbi:DNA polymerase epsilon subunit B [Diutina catenulata]